MGSFELKIDLGNAAMQTADDVADALVKVAARLKGREWSEWSEKIRDANGNTVGSFSLDGAKVPHEWEVVVGNVGSVYKGEDEERARADFDSYVSSSKSGRGRAGGESVTLFCDGEIEEEHEPPVVPELDPPHDA